MIINPVVGLGVVGIKMQYIGTPSGSIIVPVINPTEKESFRGNSARATAWNAVLEGDAKMLTTCLDAE